MDASTALNPPLIPTKMLDKAELLVVALVEACIADDHNTPELHELRILTTRDEIETGDFHELWGSVTERECAHALMMPKAEKIANFSESVLINIYKKVDEFLCKPELDYYLDLLRLNVGNDAVGLVFQLPCEEWIQHLVEVGELSQTMQPNGFAPTPEQYAKEALRNLQSAILL